MVRIRNVSVSMLRPPRIGESSEDLTLSPICTLSILCLNTGRDGLGCRDRFLIRSGWQDCHYPAGKSVLCSNVELDPRK